MGQVFRKLQRRGEEALGLDPVEGAARISTLEKPRLHALLMLVLMKWEEAQRRAPAEGRKKRA